ncbi:hypothetical protein QQP08_002206 [Theobroma cacao]|nr:hypothetical protein QQP08_002206 [Theobroma cacao]
MLKLPTNKCPWQTKSNLTSASGHSFHNTRFPDIRGRMAHKQKSHSDKIRFDEFADGPQLSWQRHFCKGDDATAFPGQKLAVASEQQELDTTTNPDFHHMLVAPNNPFPVGSLS